MKKFGKTLALLAAGALLFGSVLSSCSSESDDNDDVSVTGVTLDSTSLELKVGEKSALTATVAPDDATNKKVSWSTGSGEIATVDGGNVTAVAKGSTTITVTTEDGEKTASCKVSVYEEQEYKFGESTVVVKDFGDAGTKATVTSGETVTEATVTVADGTMTIANSEGTTLYTATVKEDGTIDTSTVKDSSGNAVTVEEIVAITITAADGATSVEVDGTLQLAASVEGVTWSSSDETKATVDQTGLVTGVAAAESVTIKASKEGNYTAGTITLAVNAAENADDGSYIFTTNDLGYEHTDSTTETIKEVKTYLDEKVTLIASESMSFTVGGFNSDVEVAELDKKVRGYIKMTARGAITADNWLTSATRTIAFKVPAGTSKVYIAASNGSSKSGTATKSTNITVVYDKTNVVLNKTLASGEKTGVATEEIDVAALGLTEDKIFYLYNSQDNGGESGSTLNLRGIYVQSAASAKTLSSIKVTTNPTKTNYALNETFESAGLAVTATYSDGSTKALSSAKYTLSSPDMTTTGDKEVTVTYAEGIADKFTINVGTLESIAVTTAPRTTYSLTDTALDTANMVVTATYSNKYTRNVASSVTTSGFKAGEAGEQTITVSYTEGEVTKTDEFKVTVENKKATGITITTKPTKNSYLVGEALDLSGLVISVAYTSGDPDTVAYSDDNAGLFSTSGFDSSAAAESQTVTVTYSGLTATFDVTVQSVTYFTKFDAAELYGEATSNITISAEKTASDGSWTLAADSTNKAVVKKGTFATYDYDATAGTGYSWANRLSFEKKNASLKLKVGAGKSVVLRVDGGGSDSATSYTEGKTSAVFTFKGAGDAVTWSPVVSLSTFYASVTGDSDGYVVITAATAAGANIYGITVVDSAVDLAGKTREEVKYNNPTFTLGKTASIEKGQSSVTLDAGAKATKTTFTALVDGTAVTTADSELTDVTFTYAWSKDGAAIEGGTSSTYSATAAGSYTVAASYTTADKKTYSATSSECAVTNLNQSDVTVIFDVNGGTGTMENLTLPAGSGTLTKNAFTREGYTFSGWNTNADGKSGTSYTDGQEVNLTENTTLYAVWKDNSSVPAPYTLDLSKVTTNKVSGQTVKVDDTISIVAASSKKNIQNKGKYIAMTGAKVQISNDASYGIQVTLTAEATVVITATCKTSAGTWSMIDTTNTSTTYASDTNAVLLSTADTDIPSTLTFANVAAGTYLLGATANGGNLYSLVITY